MAKNNKTAAYVIFHFYYKVSIPQHFLYTKDYASTYGIPTSGNRAIDKEMANSKVLCQLTIAQMSDYLSKGANMALEDPTKAIEIYDTIKEHLMDWENRVRHSPFALNVPMEDLRKLEELAKEVFKIAKIYMTKAPQEAGIFGLLSALEGKQAIFTEDLTKKKDSKPTFVNELEHQPITETILKETFAKSKKW